jgi:poly(3-hydroxybutyrate) depolymerase
VWPGGTGIAPERLVGPSTTVVSANVELWSFVRRFRRADAPALVAR